MKPYPSYKDSGVEWIGKIPTNWGVVRTKHISDFGNGYSYKSDEWVEEGIPVIRMSNISKDGKLRITDSNTKFISQESSQNTQQFKLNKGDILISMTDMNPKLFLLGKTMIFDLDGDYFLNQRVGRITITSDKCLIKFYHYVSNTNCVRNQLKESVYPNVQSNLSTEYIRNGKIILPPLPQQHQIVEYLDEQTQKVDELIEKTETKIELLKEKRTSLVNHCVTKGLNPNVEMKDSAVEWIGEIPSHWEVRRITTFGTFSKGRGIKKDEIKPSGIPCIRYGEIYTEYDRIVFDTVSFIDEESSQTSELVKKGDVLFTGSGETIDEIGKTIVYYGDDDIFVGGDVIILKLKGNLNPLFISYVMNSNYVNHQKSSMSKGEIVVHIYSKQLKEIETTLPPLPEQHQIVEYLDEQTQLIDTTIEKETRRIELLKEYRQSLISEVVTGKIDVRGEVVV